MRTIEWIDNTVKMIDQTKLPQEEVFIYCRDHKCVAEAIKTMKIRGAPALGAAVAMGIAIGTLNIKDKNKDNFYAKFESICNEFAQTRPTAINLFWGIDKMKKLFRSISNKKIEVIKQALIDEAINISEEDVALNKKLGRHGAELINNGDNILTHCNAGGLATVEYGTALGVIRTAVEEGKKVHVYVDETRPCLQGSRLTVWELMKDNIPTTLITDNMAGFLMKKGRISLAIVGADRIASNGDTANKIGTYTLSILALAHKIPFYVAAPMTTIDYSLENGDDIPIEERDPEEVTRIGQTEISPKEVNVYNPAFDITPSKNITAIITDKGIARPPYKESLLNLKNFN